MNASDRQLPVELILARPGVWVATLVLAMIVMPLVLDVSGPTIPTVLFVATYVSVSASMGLWLGFGHSPFRLIMIGIGSLFISTIMYHGMGGRPDAEAFVLFLFFAWTVIATVALPVFVTRLVRRGRLAVLQDASGSNEALQFRVSHLLLLMTFVGVATLLGKAVWPLLQNDGQNEWLLVLKLGCTLGICSVVVIWSTLGREALLRTLVSALCMVGLAWVNSLFLSPSDGWLWMSITLIVWTQITILMWLVRVDGIRFISDKGGVGRPR